MKLVLAVACALFISAAHAAVHDTAEPADPEVIARTHRSDPGADPWWAGFNDPVLGSLQRVARGRLSAAAPASASPTGMLQALRATDARVAVAYVGIRTMDLRSALLGDLQAAMQRHRQLLSAAGPTPSAAQAVAVLDARLAAADQKKAGLQSARDTLLNAMVESTGMPSAIVQSVLTGDTAPSPDRRFPTFAASAQSVLAVAPSDAVRSLYARTDALNERVAGGRRQADAAIQRWKSGLASEHDALVAIEALLYDEDQLSESGAQLDLAWIDAYVQSVSGAAWPPRAAEGVIQRNVGTP